MIVHLIASLIIYSVFFLLRKLIFLKRCKCPKDI